MRRSTTARGFSIIEVLIAAAILLFIAIGVLPLFTRSMINNLSGNESTTVTNFSRSDVEELFQLNFNHADLDVATGQTKRDLPKEYWLPGSVTTVGDESWGPTAPGVLFPWERQTTVRDFAIDAFDDGLLEESEALDGGAEPERQHLKGIASTVTSGRERGSALGSGRQITLRILKSQ
jgi:type II secretory pathway pseudopilin PulG